MMKNLLLLLFTFINILKVFGASEDCKNLKRFLSQYDKIEDECCNTDDVLDAFDYVIKCDDNNYITYLELVFAGKKTVDFSTFPSLSKLTNITVVGEGSTFGNYMVPSKLFELPAIKRMEIRGAKSMCQSVSSSSTLEELYLDTDNSLNKFPYILKDLKKLKILSLEGNQIEGSLTSEIKKFTALEELNLSRNKLSGEIIIPDKLKVLIIDENSFSSYSKSNSNSVLEKISVRSNNVNDTFVSDIIKVKSLKDINLASTKITSLPNAIFNLTNIEKLDLHSNQYLKTRIINFGYEESTPLNYCNFDSINILCYQNNTCAEEETYIKNIKQCTEKEINQIRFGNASLRTLKYSKVNFISIPLIMLIIYSLF